MGSVDVEDGKGPSTSAADLPPQRRRERDCLLTASRLLNAATAVCALLCVCANGMAIAVAPHEPVGLLMLRIYGSLFGLGAVLVETEWERVLAGARVLESWLCRGLGLGFVATLTLELTSSVAEGGQTDFHKSLRLYRAVAGTSLLACAAVYVAAGLLCLGRLKRARSRREAERVKVTGEMAALEAKRRELQGLLATYSAD